MSRPLAHQDLGCQPGRSPLNNITTFLDRHAAAFPTRPAFRWLTDPATGAHTFCTYGELHRQVQAVAAGLRAAGLATGDRVFVFVPMSAALYVTLFAVQRLGAIAVFLDSWARREQLADCAAQVAPRGFIGPAAALALADAVPALTAAPIRLVVGPLPAGGAAADGRITLALATLVAGEGPGEAAAVAGEDTALVTFTTGSSGAPKGANRTHRFLAAQHHALWRTLPYGDDEVDLPVFPIFALHNIAAGVTTVLPAVDLARPAADDGARLLTQLAGQRATGCTLSPSLLRGVAAAGQAQGVVLPSLRRVATGGAPIGPDDVAAIRAVAPAAEIHILYGSTEVEPIAHLVAGATPMPVSDDGVCVGTLAEGLQYRLLRLERGPIMVCAPGWTRWLAPPDEPGELAVCGDHVCRDYYQNPDAFLRAKIVDNDGAVWHRTGDMVRVDAAGRLWVVDRVHNAITRAGRLLFPVTAEAVLRALPFVQAAAYLGLPDDLLGERAVAVFQPRPGVDVPDAAAQIRAALAARGQVVDEVRQVPLIPLDPRHHSKVEYSVLRAQLLGAEMPPNMEPTAVK